MKKLHIPINGLSSPIGLGQAVKGLLDRLGIQSSSGCNCDARAASLDDLVEFVPLNLPRRYPKPPAAYRVPIERPNEQEESE